MIDFLSRAFKPKGHLAQQANELLYETQALAYRLQCLTDEQIRRINEEKNNTAGLLELKKQLELHKLRHKNDKS